MENFFITNYWNKQAIIQGITLDSYFRIPKSKDSYLPFATNYLNVAHTPDLYSTLIRKATGLVLTYPEREMLGEVLEFKITSSGDGVFVSRQQLFQQFLAYLGKRFNKCQVQGKLLNQVIKPFCQIYELLKKDSQLREFKRYPMNQENHKKMLRKIFQKAEQMVEKNRPRLSSVDSSDRPASEAKEKVLREVQILMERINRESLSDQHQSSNNQFDLMQKSLKGGKSSRTIITDKNIGCGSNKKVRFRQIASTKQMDDEECLCQELELLIKKTDQILKPVSENLGS